MEYIWSVIALQNCLETCFLLIRFLSEKTDMLFYYFTMTVSLIVILKEWERTRVLEPLGSVYLRECVCVCVCARALCMCMCGRVILVGHMMGYFLLSLFYLISFCLLNTSGTNDTNFFLK